jgi:hypothetical protein
MERVAGIEPACAAWKAAVLPLNYTRAELNPTITVPTLRIGASRSARSFADRFDKIVRNILSKVDELKGPILAEAKAAIDET